MFPKILLNNPHFFWLLLSFFVILEHKIASFIFLIIRYYALYIERKTLMETFEGLLIDTYVLQEQPMMLTGLNLQLEDRVINGLLKDRYLAKYILRLPLNKYVLEVSGKWNRRNQLVIKKMMIKNIDEYIKIIGTPE